MTSHNINTSRETNKFKISS